MTFRFIVERKGGNREIRLGLRGAVLCGYTGRDRLSVQRHIDELKKCGVETPLSVPTFYPKAHLGICLEEEIYVEGGQTSGEVEYILLLNEGKIYVGVGSDHTDRELEKVNVLKSKQTCPGVLSRRLWEYEEIRNHWDRIEIRSWAMMKKKRILYQDSTLSTILPPKELIRLVQKRVKGSLEGIAIFSGTPPLVAAKVLFAKRFEGQLLDPVLMREIKFGYSINPLDWFKSSKP